MPNNFNDPSSENEKTVIPGSDLAPEMSSAKAAAQSGPTDEVENFWQELLYIVVMSVVLAVGIGVIQMMGGDLSLVDELNSMQLVGTCS